jgi:hypothetical protein
MTTKLQMLQAIDRKLSGVIATTDHKARLIRKINATLDHAIGAMDGWITLNGNSGEDENGFRNLHRSKEEKPSVK